jgi:ketosteroid isomerase-like protein
MMRGVDQFLDAAQDYRVNVPEVTDLNDSQVLAVVRLAMKGKASDIDVNATIFPIVTVEDGLIIRIDEYLERAEALEAAGFSE